MAVRTLSVPASQQAQAIVGRPRPGGSPETLVLGKDGVRVLRPGSGTTGGNPDTFELELRLELSGAEQGRRYSFSPCNSYGPATYDSATDCVYFFEDSALMRLDGNNTVRLVAGSMSKSKSEEKEEECDGIGAAARFRRPTALVANGAGSLFVLDDYQFIRRVALADGQVSTTRLWPAGLGLGRCLAYLATRRQLIAATHTGLYRIIVDDGSIQIIAGQQDGQPGWQDGVGPAARFCRITGAAVSPDGLSAYLIDNETVQKAHLRKVDLRTGDVTTLTSLSTACKRLTRLPGSQGLAAVALNEFSIHVFQAAQFNDDSVAAGALPPPPSSLLLVPPAASGPATVNVRVGSPSNCRVFAAHRALLAQRSGYFRGLLEGGFREGSAAEVELPDADPDCFAPLLEYMCRDTLGGMTEAQLRPTAELAVQLLLEGGLPAELQRRLLAASTPASLLADLVWAEGLGLWSLAAELWERLWSPAYCQQVLSSTPAEVMAQLMVEVPQLVAQVKGRCVED